MSLATSTDVSAPLATASGPSVPDDELIIDAAGASLYWRDVWRYRELLLFLTWRDILIRYKQTVIGVAWAVLRPLLMMLVFTFVFGRIAKLNAGGVPYSLLVFA